MKYKITFFDFWHLGSGTSAGASLDSLVVKDSFGLPYVPGKTLKGLVRENMELHAPEKVSKIFGEEGSCIAESYFSNATLDEKTRAYLKTNISLQKHLFDKITSTKIEANGIAKDKSLREIEVVVPLTLTGEIHCEDASSISDALMMIKQMGLNRNRGLGRCKVEVEK